MRTRVYQGDAEEDLALAVWWQRLYEAEELEGTVPRSAWALGPFLRFFAPPAQLIYAEDARGLTLAVWAQRWNASGVLGLWVRPDHRRTRRGLALVAEAVWHLLSQWPVLVVLTREAGKRGLYEKVGVRFASEPIPALLDGAAAWVGWLTARTFTPPDARPDRWASNAGMSLAVTGGTG